MAGRFHAELADAHVHSFNALTLFWRARAALERASNDRARLYRYYSGFGQAFARAVTQRLEHLPIHAARHAFFGFTNGSLETLRWCKQREIFTVLDQISAAQTEERLFRLELERWPGWQSVPAPIPDEYYERIGYEWQLADRVLVNSSWSASALIEQGVPQEKLLVVPLAYEGALQPPPASQKGALDGPLRVLWLGKVNLQKGIAYLLQAAKRLAPTAVRFDIVGPVGISDRAIASAPEHVTFHGRVTRDRVSQFYARADLFVFPTLSDGFGITQLEAMAHGLPVIATDHCGSVVQDAVNGRLIPAGDAEKLAEAIAWFCERRRSLPEYSAAALERSREFTLTAYARRFDEQLASNPKTHTSGNAASAPTSPGVLAGGRA